MKKLAALLISMLLISVVLSAEVITTGNGKNSVTIVNDNADETILQFQIGEFEKNRVFIEGEDWFQILLPKEGITQEKGYPELPVFNRSIIIPEQALMAMEVFDIEYKDFQIKVAPSKGVITRNIEPTSVPYIFKDIYRENSFYPQTIADLSEPYILRDFRGITVLTNPFAYNPVTGTLRVYTAYKVRIYPDGIDTVNTLNRSRTSLSRSFYSLYENQFLNWNSYRYTPVDDSYGKLLVICHTNFLSQIAPYINWKRQKGIDT